MSYYIPQTLQELLEANQGYLNWLRSMGAAEAERNFIESLRPLATAPGAYVPYAAYMRSEIPFRPLIQIGGVAFFPYTLRSKSLASESDPLNLLFTGNANVRRVAQIFAGGLFPPELDWRSTALSRFSCAKIQYVCLEREGTYDFPEMRYTIAMGGCLSNPRCHIRLFDGGDDEQLGKFTLANVHYEHFDLSIVDHVVDDWDRSQAFVHHLFDAIPSCRSVRVESFQAEENVQNVPNDGLATIIELE